MKRIGILTSGGDAPGMNAAIRAVVRRALSMGMEVYGIERGFEGLIDAEIFEMNRKHVANIIHRGGTVLKTARSKRFVEPEGQEQAVRVLDTFGIEGLVVIGGDGSFHGAAKLAERGINVMGIPGTIDNDMAYTDATVGFDTAVNTIIDMISRVRDTSSSHEKTTIIEVMGRECGDLALYAGLAGGADVILVPEIELDVKEVCRKVLKGQKSDKAHSVIVMAEGVDITAEELKEKIEEMTGRETRLVVPGFIQRGGSPTERDILLASLCGAKAVEMLYEDSSSKAIGIREGKIVAMDFEDALNATKEFDHYVYELAHILG